MPTRPPPPRYRVVERGRRLEVIDTLTGEPAARVPAAAPTDRTAIARRWPSLPEQEGFDGRAVLVTHRWYDRKAPRRVLLDPGTMQWLGMARGAVIGTAVAIAVIAAFAPAVLVVLLAPLVLLQRGAREAVRARVTDWLNGLDAAGR